MGAGSRMYLCTMPMFYARPRYLIGRGRISMRVGMIGLGRMGAHMARNLAKAGHEVAAFDVVPAAVAAVAASDGIRGATNVADAARDAEVVCSSLPSPQSVEEIATGEGGLL